MITSLSVSGFKAVPYLETSLLMENYPKGLKFSTKKPNVIVGPNGAGKSALLKTLALHTLSYQTGESAFDDNYTGPFDADAFWDKEDRWSRVHRYLHGLQVKSDYAPALYYQPGHIPGHDNSVAAAMMTGYFDEAKAYDALVRKKSSGQMSLALLEKLRKALEGDLSILGSYQYINWSGGEKPLSEERMRHASASTERSEVLKKLYGHANADATPVLLLDEPEQSLDAKAELTLWRQIELCDTSRVQVIVATHSLYPLLHPEHFHVIEAVPGYSAEVQTLL